MRFLRRFADSRAPDSFAVRLRRKRFRLFAHLMKDLQRPVRVLDVGGEPIFWERMGFADDNDVAFVVYNIVRNDVHRPNFTCMVGDARRMAEFKDQEFNVVFSNSVIEHVGDFSDQQRMASEIRRVGERYFVQTPNRYFPIEPHFLFPFFQFLPLWVKVFLIRHVDITFKKKKWSREETIAIAGEIRLLNHRELRKLFPGATIYRERLLGLTKSFIVYDGWRTRREQRGAFSIAETVAGQGQ